MRRQRRTRRRTWIWRAASTTRRTSSPFSSAPRTPARAWAPSSRSARPSSKGARAPHLHETKLRVRYSETDAQGIVNNANYLSYFEVGRVEWLRAAGLSYKELEARGYGFVVVEVRALYKRAARFDDELVLRTELADLSRASLRFEYVVSRAGE